ncbi:hypothetical protein CERZMDRAFT_83319 [Cercospora zeae-maydis SCOH1-5]|uniref:Uncharacterized protein n=1 Tax=Cercospora zeae-maydis SCOH1-5 TaxID=717836 RepID=A0A6A6FKI4_9PEZI|nr:hypothetical protein CERZMDRAFT_83319 [Cercospora zeae-maydis SCOH1-5]
MPSNINRRIKSKGAGLRRGPFSHPGGGKRQKFNGKRDLPRAMRRIEEAEYTVSNRREFFTKVPLVFAAILTKPLFLGAARITQQNQDLYHNKYYRGRFTSGTIIGWYTHPSLESEWSERGNKTRLQCQLARKTKHFSKETKARYMKIKQGYISTDWILTEIEQRQVRTMYANALTAAEYSHEDEEKESRALWRQQKLEEAEKARLQAILKALGNGRVAPPCAGSCSCSCSSRAEGSRRCA